MGVYQELGVAPVINASGTLTRLGGSRMAPEVLAAMAEAAASFVRIDELQARAGEVIAEVTGAEAGYVVTGAAAGLALGMAACVAGLDVAKMDRLPDTTGMKNEVVVQRGHRNAYDHAIRMAGVHFVEVGYLGYPGAGGTFNSTTRSPSVPPPSPALSSTRRARCLCRSSPRSPTPNASPSSSTPPPRCRLAPTCAASSPRAPTSSASQAARRSAGRRPAASSPAAATSSPPSPSSIRTWTSAPRPGPNAPASPMAPFAASRIRVLAGR
jgi:hypothetical protein